MFKKELLLEILSYNMSVRCRNAGPSLLFPYIYCIGIEQVDSVVRYEISQRFDS